MKSQTTTETKKNSSFSNLHVNGEVDKNLSMNFHMMSHTLEFIRWEHNTDTKRYRKFSRIPFLNSYLRKRARESNKRFYDQFNLTREIYQQSDEYKKTRGY